MRPPPFVIGCCVLTLFAGCGGESARPDGADAPVAAAVDAAAFPDAVVPSVRVTIAPSAVLFTGAGQEHALSATAVDDGGRPVTGAVTWTTSDATQVTVGDDGIVRSVSDLGSAMITAEMAGVRSPPLAVVTVQLRPDTVLVTDAQVVSIGTAVLGAAPDLGAEYDVTLRGVAAPGIGVPVLAGESARVAGRVVSARTEGDNVVVRLHASTLDDLLERYDLALAWTVADLLDGPPEETSAPAKPRAAFECKGDASAKLSKNLIDISLARTGTFSYVDSKRDASLPPDFLQVRWNGELAVTGSVGLKAEASFVGKVGCELKYSIPIPIGGFLAFFIAPAIPVAMGVKFDGKLVLASLELSLVGKLGVKFDLGVTCGPGTQACATIQKVEPINDLEPKVEVPSADQMRVELAGSLYFKTGLDITFLGGAADFGIAELEIDLKQSSNLAFIHSQGEDKAYASSYKLDLGYSLGLGGDVKDLVAYLGKGLVAVDAKVEDSITLARSPTGTMVIDKAKIAANQNAQVAIDLQRDVAYGPLGYNVASVELYRKKKGSDDYEHKASIAAVQDRTHFDWLFRPTDADFGEQEFFAFVKTKFPVVELEIADDSAVPIEVLAICAAGPLAKVPGVRPANGCGGTVTHTIATTLPFLGTTMESVSAQVHLVKDTATTSPYTIGFRPTGTFTYERSGTIGECTIRIAPTAGTLATAPYAGGLLLYTDSEPFRYDGAMTTGPFTVTQVMSCPDNPDQVVDIPSWDVPLFFVLPEQDLHAGADGKTLVGHYETVSETVNDVWDWDLSLD